MHASSPCILQLSSVYYEAYARHLSSWGYVTVQYNLAFWSITADAVEVGGKRHQAEGNFCGSEWGRVRKGSLTRL